MGILGTHVQAYMLSDINYIVSSRLYTNVLHVTSKRNSFSE